MSKQNKNISKVMSLILRHKPEYINVELDENGWLSIEDLIQGINNKGMKIDMDLLHEIVVDNDKQRFIINHTGDKIRANQGHSVHVNLQLQEIEPPEFLYHGTVQKFLNSINEQGLLKMSRQHVHLSLDLETAIKVGSRRGKPIILKVNARIMHQNGVKFFKSENGVWLTDYVAPEYIESK